MLFVYCVYIQYTDKLCNTRVCTSSYTFFVSTWWSMWSEGTAWSEARRPLQHVRRRGFYGRMPYLHEVSHSLCWPKLNRKTNWLQTRTSRKPVDVSLLMESVCHIGKFYSCEVLQDTACKRMTMVGSVCDPKSDLILLLNNCSPLECRAILW